jgi:hypothetical protein
MVLFRERRVESHGRVVGRVDEEVPVDGLCASRRHPRGDVRAPVHNEEREGATPAGRAALLPAFQGERLSFEVERGHESREELSSEDTVELVSEGDLARIEVGEREGGHRDGKAGQLDRDAALGRTAWQFQGLRLPAPEARGRAGVEKKPERGAVDAGADEGRASVIGVDGNRRCCRRGGDSKKDKSRKEEQILRRFAPQNEQR